MLRQINISVEIKTVIVIVLFYRIKVFRHFAILIIIQKVFYEYMFRFQLGKIPHGLNSSKILKFLIRLNYIIAVNADYWYSIINQIGSIVTGTVYSSKCLHYIYLIIQQL